jgi:hypothetical protein
MCWIDFGSFTNGAAKSANSALNSAVAQPSRSGKTPPLRTNATNRRVGAPDANSAAGRLCSKTPHVTAPRVQPDARIQLGREILDADALHDISLSQLVLKAVEVQVAGPKLA